MRISTTNVVTLSPAEVKTALRNFLSEKGVAAKGKDLRVNVEYREEQIDGPNNCIQHFNGLKVVVADK